jgi:hypothetical protein
MISREIMRRLSAKPFEPFRLMVADGQHYDVLHPESIAVTGNGRLVSVALRDSFALVDLLLVTTLIAPIPRKVAKRKSA